MLTTLVNETQVDFNTAIIYNEFTNTQTYEHVYLVRNGITGNDIMEESDDIILNDPCSPNPCLNGGSCSLGFGNVAACYCLASFAGKKIFFLLI